MDNPAIRPFNLGSLPPPALGGACEESGYKIRSSDRFGERAGDGVPAQEPSRVLDALFFEEL